MVGYARQPESAVPMAVAETVAALDEACRAGTFPPPGVAQYRPLSPRPEQGRRV